VVAPRWTDWGTDEYVKEPPPVWAVLLGSVCVGVGIAAIALLLESLW
jgi:hypothetical protein